MKIQRERERIRSQEVVPLEEKVKELEAKHSELNSLVAQLRNTSSELPPNPHETAFQDLYNAQVDPGR
jgi:hypothetical protein